MGLAVDGANRPDMKLARQTLESIPVERPEPTPEDPQGLCLDLGHAYDEVEEIAAEFGSRRTSRPRRGKRSRSSGRRVTRRGVGWWSERTVG